MKRPSFLYGVTVALGIALAGGAVFGAMAPLLGTESTLRLVIPAAGLAYLVCLLMRSAERTGRITTVTLWFAASLLTWLLAPPIAVYVIAHAAMLWLVRSLYFHSGALSALLDLGITVLGVSAAGWAVTRSGSVPLAIWCFLLVQAAFVFIPARWPLPSSEAREKSDQAFECARRRADAALRQLFTR